MKRREWILGLVVMAAVVGLFAYEQHVHPFDFRTFAQEFHRARWSKVLIGLGCIYLGLVLRAIRWAWLLRPIKRVPLLSMLGSQVMGFTAVALIGRIRLLRRRPHRRQLIRKLFARARRRNRKKNLAFPGGAPRSLGPRFACASGPSDRETRRQRD